MPANGKMGKNNLSIQTAAAGVLSLDASSGLLATRRFGAGTFRSVLSLGGVRSARLRGFVFCPGGSAVWPRSAGCVLCVLWAMSAAALGGGTLWG